MIEITFKDFYDYNYRHDVFFELYVMKNSLEEALYVGISSKNIWERWFGWNGHIMAGPKHMTGESPVGQKIVDHLPESWNWKIQLWTLDDCKNFCAEKLNPRGKYDIQWLEPMMIQKLRPSLNVIYNLNPGVDRQPKSAREKQREAELDRAFREIFDEKKRGKK
ncbi:MAG: hypothetical protein IT313_06785 [Anaerolineales bacterium]|nr:hypothetical protein [Anaerolineales bacterium]